MTQQIQDNFRYYLMAIADVTSTVLAACDKRNAPATTSILFLNRDGGGAPQEIMIKVRDALDEWEAGQAWVGDALNVFQFDPPAARGDIDDRNIYAAENAMSWPSDDTLPAWYVTVYNNNVHLQPYMTAPD